MTYMIRTVREPLGLMSIESDNLWLKIRRLYWRIRDGLRKRNAYRHLLSQPDHRLDDVGLTRSEVSAALRRPLI